MPPKATPKGLPERFVEFDDPAKKIFDAAPEPGGGYVRELRAHVGRFGTPDTWDWHLKSKPPKGGPPPILIAKNIDVPERLRADVGRAPCPLCSLTAPKYFYGILTWWPAERALRVIGIECARKFFGEAFDKEILRFDRQQRASADLGFLIDALPLVRPMRTLVEELAPLAAPLDWLRGRLLRGLTKKDAKALYRHVATNKGLALFEERWIDFGNSRERLRVVAKLFECNGFEALNEWRRNPSDLINAAGRHLEGLHGETEEEIIDAVSEMGDAGMAQARGAIIEAGRYLREALDKCGAIQHFLAAENIERLMGWSFDHRAEIHVNVKRDDFGAAVFKHGPHTVSVPLNSAELSKTLPSGDALQRLSKLVLPSSPKG